ncbi:MAG: hypothetical protein IPO21_14390 [Bacteroidales bacterium]|nr:hypothetical protein [Bacteroidales bacterium]
MATSVEFREGTEAQILALTPQSSSWIEKAFYYPSDKTYFYRVVNNVMVRYGAGEVTNVGIGITLNEKVIGGVKTFIEQNDTLLIPDNYDYNTFRLDIEGTINCFGQINIMN